MPRRFVLVSGLPGSGKSTVARQIAPALGLPVIDKDQILERLFEEKGTGDAAWRRSLSRDSDRMLRAEAAEAPNGAVLVSFWRLQGMPEDSGTPVEWLRALASPIVHVRCMCPVEIAIERFRARERHAGHLDRDLPAEEMARRIRTTSSFGHLEIGERVAVDTTGAICVDSLANEIESAFRRPHFFLDGFRGSCYIL